MIIRDVILSTGQSSFVNRDRLAIRRGAKPNGYLYDGEPALAGFDTIVQAGEIVSVILVLEDGSLAFGDCVDVISAGYAGRDRRFRAADHLPTLRSRLVPGLIGQPLDSFRVLAAEVDAMAVEGERLHTAVRYGVTQALLHAVALSRREQVAETLAREYGLLIGRDRLPILSLCARNNTDLHDRMILKRADILPHASFGEIDQHVGRDGQLFLDYVRYFRDR